MTQQKSQYELFQEYAQIWESEFKESLQKLFKMNANLNQNLDSTKKDLKKLFKSELDSYHSIEKYHMLQEN